MFFTKLFLFHRESPFFRFLLYQETLFLNAGILGETYPHGLRHAFAQTQYKKLTGWEYPKRGGPTYRQLTREQKEQDKMARLTITEWLGHSRVAIVANYCGQ